MAQADYNFGGGQDGAQILQELNGQLESIATNNSGDNAPQFTFPFMPWADTDNGLLKQRNSTNTAWVVIGELDTPYLGLSQKLIYRVIRDDADSGVNLSVATWDGIRMNAEAQPGSNLNGAFNFTNSIWTCPRAGWWNLGVSVSYTWTSFTTPGNPNPTGTEKYEPPGPAYAGVGLGISSQDYGTFEQVGDDATGQIIRQYHLLKYLNLNEQVRPQYYLSGLAGEQIRAGIHTWFSADYRGA